MKTKGDNPMYEWSRLNTKQVRIHTEVWKILKEQAREEEKSMMQVLNKLIMESYSK